MKVLANRHSCAGHGRCQVVAPELFVLDNEGYIASDGFDIPLDMELLARRGAKAFPERIISICGDGAPGG